jgi:hemerythrin-like metal-binding protein
MDRQHDILIELMSSLRERAEEGASKAELSDLLKQLSDYTVLHFRAEEACMEAMSYSKLDTHRLIHRDLLIRLREHVGGFETGDGTLSHRLTSFLKFWLTTHIKSVDMRDARRVSQRSA